VNLTFTILLLLLFTIVSNSTCTQHLIAAIHSTLKPTYCQTKDTLGSYVSFAING